MATRVNARVCVVAPEFWTLVPAACSPLGHTLAEYDRAACRLGGDSGLGELERAKEQLLREPKGDPCRDPF